MSGDRAYSDVNYVFPSFVLTHLPVGLVGLLIAAILAAAMSTISAELASLSTATVIDFYRRWWSPAASDTQLLWVSRAAVAFWGIFASVVAIYAANLGSLIEVVNRFGSYFYGSILGVFILAIGFPACQWPRGIRRPVRRHGGGLVRGDTDTGRVPVAEHRRRGGGVRGRRRGQCGHRRPAASSRSLTGLPVASRPLFIALGIVALVIVVSWALGEFLRQRKTTKRRPKR